MFYFLETIRSNEDSMLRKAFVELTSAVTSCKYIFSTSRWLRQARLGAYNKCTHILVGGKFLEYLNRGSQTPGPISLWRPNFVWSHIKELPSCHSSGAYEFEPARRLLEKKLINSVSDDFKEGKIYPTIGQYCSKGKGKAIPL